MIRTCKSHILVGFIVTNVLLGGCSNNEPVSIVGKWTFIDMKQGEKLIFSSDKKVQKRLIDLQVKQDAKIMKQMGVPMNKYRKILTSRSNEMCGISFDFDAAKKVLISVDPKSSSDDIRLTYQLNDTTKALIVKSNPGATDRVFKFSLGADTLVLQEGASLMRLKRK